MQGTDEGGTERYDTFSPYLTTNMHKALFAESERQGLLSSKPMDLLELLLECPTTKIP